MCLCLWVQRYNLSIKQPNKFAKNIKKGALCCFFSDKSVYTDHNYVMKINHPRNHFISYVLKDDASTVKGVFCYGTHYYIYTVKGVKIEHVKNQRMWCEVVHEKNMENDAYFLKAKMVRDGDILRREFAIDETVEYGLGIYLKFLP